MTRNTADDHGRALDPLVAAEQVRMIYHQLPVSVSGTMVGVILLAAVLWPVVSHVTLLAWGLAMAANQSWRLGLYVRFRKGGIPEGEHERWGRYWMIGSGISGCIWATAAIMFFVPGSDSYQSILIISIFAITSVAVPLIASHAPSFYVFVLPTLLSIIGINLWQGDRLHLIIGFITFCVMLGVLAVGIKYNRLLSVSLRNRFRNEILVAELQKQNAELERARQMAEQLNRAKSQFFAAASHDLRQPLHALGLFAAALSEKVRDPGVSNVVSSIGASVDALEKLFNELLDLSKIDAGAIRPEVGDFDIHNLLDRVAVDFEPEARERGLQLRIHSLHQYVRSDPLLIERILRNLITNALRYTYSGGVLVGCRRCAQCLRIEVWDTGVGIAEDQQQRVFDEFVQIGNPERDRRKGLGLGLSIVKRLSALLQHPLELQSRAGRGSMFRLELPLGSKPVLSAPLAPQRIPAVHDFSNRHILVVDDEQLVLEEVSALLQGWGAQVTTHASARDALDALSAGTPAPDLIIADYHLRADETGTEAVRSLRARFGKEIPAIMITGSTTPERIAEAKEGGFHLLLKPVMPAKLRTLIDFELRRPTADPRR
jgi:signal transduction histidine kinase